MNLIKKVLDKTKQFLVKKYTRRRLAKLRQADRAEQWEYVQPASKEINMQDAKTIASIPQLKFKNERLQAQSILALNVLTILRMNNTMERSEMVGGIIDEIDLRTRILKAHGKELENDQMLTELRKELTAEIGSTRKTNNFLFLIDVVKKAAKLKLNGAKK